MIGANARPALGARRAPVAPARAGRLGAPARFVPGLALVAIIGASALAAPWLSPYAPEAQSIAERLQPPTAAHWLGTDGFGRDLLSRLLWGGRVSLAIGFLSMVVGLAVGVLVGTAAGYLGGTVDAVLMRLTELVMVFPTFFLIILIVATFGSSVPLLILVIGATSWTVGARIIRGEVLKLRRREFVLAAEAVGASAARVMARHVLPNVAAVIIVAATIRVGVNILLEAGLSYLGLGVQPPLASWGSMVAEGSRFIRQEWWLTAAPAAAIFLTVLGFNVSGEALRDFLDPRASRVRRR